MRIVLRLDVLGGETGCIRDPNAWIPERLGRGVRGTSGYDRARGSSQSSQYVREIISGTPSMCTWKITRHLDVV